MLPNADHPPHAALETAFDKAVAAYFERVLPCFLTAHLRGGGYTLLAEMMRAHDGGDLLSICETVTPSAKSLKRALRVQAQCPPRLAANGLDPAFGSALLGLFQRRGTSIAGEMLHSYREIDVSWEVSIFADTFWATVPPERWADELLLTIFHEYIHYFESFLLRSEQPLRSREEGHHGLAERALSLDEAQRRDRRIIRRRRIIWGIALAIPLAITVFAILNAIDFETEGDREGLRRRIATTDQHIAQMQTWATAADPQGAAHRFATEMAAYKQARASAAAACGLDEHIGRSIELARGSGDPEACILAVESAGPWMAVESVRVAPKSHWVQIRLPKVLDRRPTLVAMPAPDTVSTEDGRALRAQLMTRRKTARALWHAHEATSKRLERARFAGRYSFAPLVRALRQDAGLQHFSVFWSGADFVTVRGRQLRRWLNTMVKEQVPLTVPGWQMTVVLGADNDPVSVTFHPRP